jgi:hypothetical protein
MASGGCKACSICHQMPSMHHSIPAPKIAQLSTVAAVGPEASHFAVGDPVFGVV